MVVKKRRKVRRMRGGRQHGWGKQHRGSGGSGGAGMAGTGKRSDSKKPSIWKQDYFGKKGFTPKGPSVVQVPINIHLLDEKLDSWKAEEIAQEIQGIVHLDLEKAGYNKLLGSGKPGRKLEIKIDFASENAIRKIERAGGKVVLKSAEKKVAGEAGKEAEARQHEQRRTAATKPKGAQAKD